MTDFSRWAVVAHKDDTGFGRQAADCRAVLGIGRHFVIPSERLTDHPIDGVTEQMLSPQAPDDQVRSMLAQVDGILFFERPNWHPRLLSIARSLGVHTVCVPNWEWFRHAAPEWQHCDLFICPSQFTARILNRYKFVNTVVLPWPLDLAKLPHREIKGPARTFIHNAGLVDHDDRKGTHDTIQAFQRVTRDDIRLIVRLQKPISLPELDARITLEVGNRSEVADLYRIGDVCIQPSKMEGIGFMILEAAACGFPVITTDAPPMNEYVVQPELRCATRWFRRRAFPTRWVPHAHLRLPSPRDLTRRIAWCANHDMTFFSESARALAETTFSADRIREVWRGALNTLLPLNSK